MTREAGNREVVGRGSALSVFLCASDADGIYLKSLLQHFEAPGVKGLVDVFHVSKVTPGFNRTEESKTALKRADVALFFATADSLAEEGIMSHVASMQQRSQAGGLRCFLVVLRDCVWQHHDFLRGLPRLPNNEQPIATLSLTDRDSAWVSIVGFLKLQADAPGLRDCGSAAPEKPLVPLYPDTKSRDYGERLSDAFQRLRSLEKQREAAAASEVRKEIRKLRKEYRDLERPRIGEWLGDRYQLLEQVGEGGFGWVFKAFDRERDRYVAVKALRPTVAGDSDKQKRVRRGLDAMLARPHDAIARLLDPYYEDGRHSFFVMELLSGDLARAVTAGRVSDDDAVRIVLAVGDALDRFHADDMVHRDIKPQNILLTSDLKPRLTDFDLVFDPIRTAYTNGEMIGTFLYMAPECRDNPEKDPTPAADVYSLAAVFVFCILRKHTHNLSEQTIEELPITSRLEAVLKRAVARNPQERYPNAYEFCKELGRETAGRWRAPKRQKRSKTGTGIIVVVIVVVVVATGGWLFVPDSLERLRSLLPPAVNPTPVPVPSPTIPTPAFSPTIPAPDPSPTPTATPPRPAPLACREGTRPIPAAKVWIGIDGGRGGRNDGPRHQVDIAAFCMDALEVTVTDYKRCREKQACDEPRLEQISFCNWNDKAANMTHPMNCVTWQEAGKYCKAQGRRLPTEEEWEYAARGTDERLYPWGSATPYSKAGLLNACDSRCKDLLERQQDSQRPMTTASDGFEWTAPADAFIAGRSSFGMFNMAGNVSEWTESRFCPYPKEKDCATNLRVYRGGSWYTGDLGLVTATTRDGLPEGNQGRRNYIGFRCAYTPDPTLE